MKHDGKDTAMNTLPINGSPRGDRNTAPLPEKLLDGAASAGAETETVFMEGRT